MNSHTLHFKSVNPLGSRTLLLLHGAFSSAHQWDFVSSSVNLSSFHILIPDLPSHGKSTSSSIPFSIPDTATLLADLITKHAKNGKADIVGMSLGGNVAIYLAHKYPDIIGDGGMFVSGCERSWGGPQSWYNWGAGLFMFSSTWLFMRLPTSLFKWISDKSGMRTSEASKADMKAATTYKLGKIIAQNLGENFEFKGRGDWKDQFEGVKARTCIVAATMNDKEDDCIQRGYQLRRNNPESKAFIVEGQRHAWCSQNPELFAKSIRCWMNHEDMPVELTAVE